ncbi:hypothetical protein J4437_04935 [Candidatus Woesearchaeota archaeon]|nr:hypothetical protein [Candidatus Woesearchaeota archaeon]
MDPINYLDNIKKLEKDRDEISSLFEQLYEKATEQVGVLEAVRKEKQELELRLTDTETNWSEKYSGLETEKNQEFSRASDLQQTVNRYETIISNLNDIVDKSKELTTEDLVNKIEKDYSKLIKLQEERTVERRKSWNEYILFTVAGATISLGATSIINNWDYLVAIPKQAIATIEQYQPEQSNKDENQLAANDKKNEVQKITSELEIGTTFSVISESYQEPGQSSLENNPKNIEAAKDRTIPVEPKIETDHKILVKKMEGDSEKYDCKPKEPITIPFLISYDGNAPESASCWIKGMNPNINRVEGKNYSASVICPDEKKTINICCNDLSNTEIYDCTKFTLLPK